MQTPASRSQLGTKGDSQFDHEIAVYRASVIIANFESPRDIARQQVNVSVGGDPIAPVVLRLVQRAVGPTHGIDDLLARIDLGEPD